MIHYGACVLLLAIIGIGYAASVTTSSKVQELRVRWDTHVGSPAPQLQSTAEVSSKPFTLLDDRQVPGSLPRRRNLELSSNQILIVAMGEQGDEIDRQLIPDPRVLRAEFPGPTGKLAGEVLHKTTTEFLISVPDDPTIIELRLFHPRWTGTGYVLDPLGTIPLK